MMKKSKKKNMGLEQRIAREEFLQELKSPTPKQDDGAQEILQKIRERNKRYSSRTDPYNAGAGGPMDTLLKKLRKRAGLK